MMSKLDSSMKLAYKAWNATPCLVWFNENDSVIRHYIDGTVSFPFKAPDGWSQNWLPSYIVFNQEKDFRPNEKIRTDLNLDDYMKFVLFFS